MTEMRQETTTTSHKRQKRKQKTSETADLSRCITYARLAGVLARLPHGLHIESVTGKAGKTIQNAICMRAGCRYGAALAFSSPAAQTATRLVLTAAFWVAGPAVIYKANHTEGKSAFCADSVINGRNYTPFMSSLYIFLNHPNPAACRKRDSCKNH